MALRGLPVRFFECHLELWIILRSYRRLAPVGRPARTAGMVDRILLAH